jgi:predicted transcriptional regulator
MQAGGDVANAIKYRENMAKTWQKIVKGQLNVSSCTISDIENGRF